MLDLTDANKKATAANGGKSRNAPDKEHHHDTPC